MAVPKLELDRAGGVPQLVSQEFPRQTWRVGAREFDVEMGTDVSTSLINAAKRGSSVMIVTELRCRPATNTRRAE